MCVVIPQTRAISVLSVNLRVNACVYLSVERVCVCVCVCDTDHAESVSLQRGYGGFLFSPSVNVWGALCREWAGPMGDWGGGPQSAALDDVSNFCCLRFASALLFSSHISR